MWNIMKLCDKQLRDINTNDILNNGLYRKCNTYKGGGGYDKFPYIFKKRFGDTFLRLNNQFVVQLKGCPLKCPYCYVTREGVEYGECVTVNTNDLINDFVKSGCDVFHLMGGAPALYIDNWHKIIDKINKPFHSDFLLVEKEYKRGVLKTLSKYDNCLYAVSIKGKDEQEFYRNTNTKLDSALFYSNLDKLVDVGINFYITFTGMSDDSISYMKEILSNRYGDYILKDSFSIKLIKYNALRGSY